jgi:hypothetical protein
MPQRCSGRSFLKGKYLICVALSLPLLALMGCQSINPVVYHLKAPGRSEASSDLWMLMSACMAGLTITTVTYELNPQAETHLDRALLQTLQPCGFSLRPGQYKTTLRSERNLRWKDDFWTDFAPLDFILETNRLALNNLLLVPSQGEVYRAQVIGRLGEQRSIFGRGDLELSLALRLEKRKRKGEFFFDHSSYNPKPLLDIFFRQIRGTLLETNRVEINKPKIDQDKGSVLPDTK